MYQYFDIGEDMSPASLPDHKHMIKFLEMTTGILVYSPLLPQMMEATMKAVNHLGSLTFHLPDVKKHQQLLPYGKSEGKYYFWCFLVGELLNHANTMVL